MAGNIKRYFPGGNTPDGYFSFFDTAIPWSESKKNFILKGGPGVGKSTIMKKLAKTLSEKDLNLELLHCTADSESLDGIFLPDHNIAVLDGMAPHILDPKFPGCIDEIVNLGEYWDEEGIRNSKAGILDTQSRISGCYGRGYSYLKAASFIMKNIEKLYAKSVDVHKVDLITEDIYNAVFKDIAPEKTAKFRKLFATAITPEGEISFLDHLFKDMKQKYILSGPPGTYIPQILERVLTYAISKGLNVEAFYCPMNYQKIEHIIIKDLQLGFVTSVNPHVLHPESIAQKDIIIDMSQAMDSSKISAYEGALKEDCETYRMLFDKAVASFSDITALHDDLELYYVHNMDFNKVDRITGELLAKIMKYI